MLRYLSILMLSLAVLPTSVLAQDGRAAGHRGTLQQQRACRPDVLRHCRDMQDRDDYAIVDSSSCATSVGGSGCLDDVT